MTDDRADANRSMSYRETGVDIAAGDLAKQRIAERVAGTHGPDVVRGLGHFGAFFRAPGPDNPYVLVSSADSVGTKVLLAVASGRHQGIGIDLVNHCVNDILAGGAHPLFFLDYYATPKLEPDALAEIIDGMVEACEAADCALIGGETAQLSGIYREHTYDLAGFIVGVVHEDRIIDGSNVSAGDLLVGLPSSGLHTNGYTLARSALGLDGPLPEVQQRLNMRVDSTDSTLADLLLEPHRSYLPIVQPLLDNARIAGMAHITGGGLLGNLRRVIPDGLEAIVDVRLWEVPPIFRRIQQSGNVAATEMYRVFNMGVGFVLVIPAGEARRIAEQVDGARVIGEVVTASDRSRVRLIGVAGGPPVS